jgi:hypothetical protein
MGILVRDVVGVQPEIVVVVVDTKVVMIVELAVVVLVSLFPLLQVIWVLAVANLTFIQMGVIAVMAPHLPTVMVEAQVMMIDLDMVVGVAEAIVVVAVATVVPVADVVVMEIHLMILVIVAVVPVPATVVVTGIEMIIIVETAGVVVDTKMIDMDLIQVIVAARRLLDTVEEIIMILITHPPEEVMALLHPEWVVGRADMILEVDPWKRDHMMVIATDTDLRRLVFHRLGPHRKTVAFFLV